MPPDRSQASTAKQNREVQRIKILTLNTHKGFSSFNTRFVLHELRDAIRQVEADLVFLQEVLGEHELLAPKYKNWPNKSQYEFLADSVWSEFAYGKNAVYPAGHHGNAILSKFPIRNLRQVDISTYRLETRGFLHCEVDVPSCGELHALCVHLGLFEKHRRQQLDLISAYIRENVPENAPLVVAGDFNDWRVNAEKRFARSVGLNDAFLESEGKMARSFPSFFPILPLDRVYVRGMETSRAVVLSKKPWDRLSDHAALFAEIRLTK